MKLKSVNVIEFLNGDLSQLISFSDDRCGNKQAEKCFKIILKEQNVAEEDMDSYVEDGYWSDDNGYEIFLTHSC